MAQIRAQQADKGLSFVADAVLCKELANDRGSLNAASHLQVLVQQDQIVDGGTLVPPVLDIRQYMRVLVNKVTFDRVLAQKGHQSCPVEHVFRCN